MLTPSQLNPYIFPSILLANDVLLAFEWGPLTPPYKSFLKFFWYVAQGVGTLDNTCTSQYKWEINFSRWEEQYIDKIPSIWMRCGVINQLFLLLEEIILNDCPFWMFLVALDGILFHVGPHFRVRCVMLVMIHLLHSKDSFFVFCGRWNSLVLFFWITRMYLRNESISVFLY